jgi:hypothetical protein
MLVKHNVNRVIFTKKKCIYVANMRYLFNRRRKTCYCKYRSFGFDCSVFLLRFPYRFLPKLTNEVSNADPDPHYFGKLVPDPHKN